MSQLFYSLANVPSCRMSPSNRERRLESAARVRAFRADYSTQQCDSCPATIHQFQSMHGVCHRNQCSGHATGAVVHSSYCPWAGGTYLTGLSGKTWTLWYSAHRLIFLTPTPTPAAGTPRPIKCLVGRRFSSFQNQAAPHALARPQPCDPATSLRPIPSEALHPILPR